MSDVAGPGEQADAAGVSRGTPLPPLRVTDPGVMVAGDSVARALAEILAVDRWTPDDLERVRRIAAALPVVVGVLDADLQFVAWFGGGLGRLGVSAESLMRSSLDDWGEEIRGILTDARDGASLRFETEGVTRDRPWAFSNLAVPVPGGGVAIVSIDATERMTAERALEESEDRFRQLSDAAPVGIYLVDIEGEVVYANREAERQLGVRTGAILGMGWVETLDPDDRAAVLAAEEDFRLRDARFDITFRVVRPDEERRTINARAVKLVGSSGAPFGIVAICEDITERVRFEDLLREREERTRAILENAAQGILTCRPSGRVLEFNAAAEAIFGYDSTYLIGLGVEALFSAESMDELRSAHGRLLESLEAGPATTIVMDQAEGRRRDGSVVWVEVRSTAVRTTEGVLITHLVRDLSERQSFEERLRYQATHDDATGLPNRALLTAQLSSAITRAAYNRTDLAVLYVRLDRFEVVTDSLGHAVGDELLFQAAERIRIVCEPTDLVARLGSSDFVVLVEGLSNVTGAVGRAASILEVLSEPFGLTDDEAFIDPYVGVAYAPFGRGATTDSLVGDAALAAQRAAERATPGFELFDREMRARVDERRRTENALRRGIERGELELHYQPVVGLLSGAVHGFEALVRWNRPGVGRVSPGDFIPIAEESGLILPMGNWILERACDQLVAWQDEWPERELHMSVNLSARQLSQFDVAERVGELVKRSGFEPDRLILELTETVLLRDVDAAARTLAALKGLGVRIAMDDFGTGYSSLTYLRRFPIDIVKIDRSFVGELGTDSRDASIVDMVVALARSLGLTVVAEGVETEAQRDALVKIGCAFAQGFHFSRPEPASQIPELLAILRS